MKRILIWLIGCFVIVGTLLQIYHIVYLAQTFKADFFKKFPFTMDMKYLFLSKAHIKLLWIALITFTVFVLVDALITLIKKSKFSKNEDGDKINYTSLSTKNERKKGLVRIEVDKKGNITTNTLRWKLDFIFNKVKRRYNKVLKFFKVHPSKYVNTYNENKSTFNSQKQYHVGGLPLIVEKKWFNLLGHYSRYYLSSGNIHSLFIGSTGRGKSATYVIPMLYFYAFAGENVMLNDPKGELYDATREMFLERGYNVIVLDYQNTKNSKIWNPLQIPKEIYKKEITSYLFHLKIKDVKVDEVESPLFYIYEDNDFEWMDDTVKIFKKDGMILNGEIDSIYYDRYVVELYVTEIQHWSKNNVKTLLPRKIGESEIADGKFNFELKESFEDGSQNISEAIEMLRDISNAITFDANTNDSFWNSGAADMITGGALLLLERGEIDKLNFKSIRLLFNNDAVLTNYIQKTTTVDSYSRKYISSYLNATGNTKSSLNSVFMNKMSLLDANENIAQVTSNDSSFDLKNVGFEKTAIFIIVHDEKKTYHPLVSMFTKQLYETLVNEIRKRQLETLPVPFNLILDEFGVMPPLKDVDAILAAARSRSIRFNAFIQSFEQLQRTYGRDIAKVIEDNCTNVIYLSSKTDTAAEYFEKAAGNKLIKTKNGYKSVPVITKDRLKQFQKGKSLITTIERKPYISTLPPVFEYPMYRKTSVYRDNIEHKEVQLFNIEEENAKLSRDLILKALEQKMKAEEIEI